MRTLSVLWILILVTASACIPRSVTDAPIYVSYTASATPDPLHTPALKPTPVVTVFAADIPQIPGRWDGNHDGQVDIRDVDIAAGDLAAMTSYLNMHGGVITLTAPNTTDCAMARCRKP